MRVFLSVQNTSDAFPCHIHLPVCLRIMDHHSRAPKKITSRGNEVLPEDSTHPVQRPCYQRGSPFQNPAGNRTTRRPADHRKETQLQWYRHVSRSSGLVKAILQGTVKGGRRQGRQEKRWGDNQGIDRPGVRHVPEGCGEERKMEETGCEIICSKPTTLAVKE